MKKSTSLIIVKTIHTIIWVIMASATVYIFYAGLFNIFNTWLWWSLGLLIVESITLMINKWTCPLTPMARKYTNQNSNNFDIYLPETLAKYNKIIFGTMFVIGALLVLKNAILAY